VTGISQSASRRTPCVRVSPHTALTFPCVLTYSVVGTASAHPTFPFRLLTGSASSLPPRQVRFRGSSLSFILLPVPLTGSALAITAVRRVILSLRDHAGITLFRSSRIYSGVSYDVCRAPVRPVSLPIERMPAGMDSQAAETCLGTCWSGVSAIFRQRPNQDHWD
jgi:hypothetical protein